MAGQNVEYVYVNQPILETELQVGQDEDGRLVLYGADGTEYMGQVVEEQPQEIYVEGPAQTEQLETEQDGSIVLESSEVPGNFEILESTDSVGGDMRFVMVNQREVFVVKNNKNNSQGKRPFPFQKDGRVMKSRRRVTPQSVKKGPKLIQDFLLPHLDNRSFGNRLVWVDRANGTFALSWCHKNGADWKADDCAVFREWDLLKDRKIQDVPQYWMEAKQRFRAALAKVSTACRIDSEEFKGCRVFQIKWTRETRPEILDEIYTSSKYFRLPPPNSLATSHDTQTVAIEDAQFLVDHEFTQEEVVVSPGETVSVDGEMNVEMVETEIIQEEEQEPQFFESEKRDLPERAEIIVESDSAQQAAADVLSSRFYTAAHRSHKFVVRRESLKPTEKLKRQALRCQSKVYTQCPMCQYLTSNYSLFLRHLMIHREEQAYTCLHCTASYKLPELFIQHLKSHHNAPPHICFLANIEATSRTELRRSEFLLVHRNLKTCGVCAEHCKTQHDLVAHVKELHGRAQLKEVRRNALKAKHSIRQRHRIFRRKQRRRARKPAKKRIVSCDEKVIIDEMPIEWGGESVVISS